MLLLRVRYDNPSASTADALRINRTAQSVTAGSGPSNSVSVSTSTNRITGMGGYTFYYDSSGNLTQDDLYKYKYDAEHRLVEIRNLSNTLISSYAYDGHSLRVIKVVGADRTWYIYAGSQLVSEFEDAASASYAANTSPGSAGSDSVATLLYQHGDHLTTRLTTDQQGQVSNEQAHYPYGEQWYAWGTADPSVERKFTSYLKDGEASTGRLNYALRQEHSGRIGRFLQPSGKGEGPQGLNSYSFGSNNPVSDAPPQGCEVPPCTPQRPPTEQPLSVSALNNLARTTPGQLGAIYGWMASMQLPSPLAAC